MARLSPRQNTLAVSDLRGPADRQWKRLPVYCSDCCGENECYRHFFAGNVQRKGKVSNETQAEDSKYKTASKKLFDDVERCDYVKLVL